MSPKTINEIPDTSKKLSQSETRALAAAHWVKMGIPISILINGKEIQDPRNYSERSDPIVTYFDLKQYPEKIDIALKTGPATGIVALSAYTYEPGTGMEALVRRGFFCSCQADVVIRHENFVGGVSDSRFHTVLYHAGADQFLETTLDELPGVTVRKSGEKILLPPTELRLFQCDEVVQRSKWELEGSIAPAGIPYLPDDLLTIIRKAERKTLAHNLTHNIAGGVKSELYDKVSEGARDNTLTRRAGYLIGHKKFSKDDALNALRDINQKCCIPPLSDVEVRKIVNSIYRKHHRNG